MSLCPWCDASIAVVGQSLPVAAPPSAALHCGSPLLLVCRQARHPLPAGWLKGPVQRQWQAGPALTAVDAGFLPRLWCACGRSLTARPPAPDQPSLARGLGRGRRGGCPAISLSLTLFRSRARPPAVKGTRKHAHVQLFRTPPLHCTLQRGSVVSALGSNRGLTRTLALADPGRPVW
jgi:hypothetical protein